MSEVKEAPLPKEPLTKVVIRRANGGDLDGMTRLGVEFYQDYDVASLNVLINPGPWGCATLNSIVNDPCYGAFVADQDGELVGMCVGKVAPAHLDPHIRYCYEMLWYVKPKSRKSTVGRRLHMQLEEWAGEMLVDAIVMVALDTSPPPVAEYYKRCGYNPLERSFIKRI